MRRLLALAAAVVAAPGFAAAKPVYGVVLKTLSDPFWSAVEQGVREGAKASGVEYFLQAVESDQAGAEQLRLCDLILQKKPAALLASGVDPANLLPCLKQANVLKIPVADLSGGLDAEAARRAGVEIAFHVGADDEAAGVKAADYVAETLGKTAKRPVLVIERPGDAAAGKRTRGFVEELKKAAPGLVVASLPGEGDGRKAASDALRRDPELAAIFCADDAMALGAVEAVRASDKDKLIVVGVGGGPEAVKSILAGGLSASVAMFPFLIGERAVETMKKALAGEKVEPSLSSPTLVLTKPVLEARKDPLLSFLK